MRIISDHGTAFENELMDGICKLTGIDQKFNNKAPNPLLNGMSPDFVFHGLEPFAPFDMLCSKDEIIKDEHFYAKKEIGCCSEMMFAAWISH